MQLAERILFKEEPDHTGFLVRLDDCGSVILNRTSVFLLKQLLNGVPEEKLEDALQAGCSTPLPPQAKQEIKNFLQNLKDKGYIQ